MNAMHDVDPRQVTGLVLAGGRGSRMGSVEKGLEPFLGRPLVERVVERFAPQVGRVVISANDRLADYERLGHPVVADAGGGASREGPLSGIAAALVTCDTEFLACVPCDAPFLPLDLVARLAGGLDGHAELAVATTASGLHPVFCLMRARVAPALGRFIADGGRSVQRWVAAMDGAVVAFDDEAAFRNLNTREELHDAERDPGGSRIVRP